MLKFLLALCCWSLMSAGYAQQRLEIIPLQHRLADQVMPALQQIIEPGGSVSVASGKVIVRASAANIAQIKEVLAAIDTPLRRLEITVRQGGDASREASGAGIRSGTVILGPNGEVSAAANGRVYSSSAQRISNTSQRVQTVEGGEAAIFVGRSIALPMREFVIGPAGAIASERVEFVDVGDGFMARPEVVGDRVTITLSPRSERMRGGSISGSRLSTTVNGRLGEWISLGGSATQRQQDSRGLAEYGARSGSDTNEVLLKVDVLQ